MGNNQTPALQTAEKFLNLEYPEKEPLIDGLLHRRDLVALGGIRRHGKTSLILNLALTLAAGKKDFLGFRIPQPRRVLLYLLEDDGGEIQGKLKKLKGSLYLQNRLSVRPRDNFSDGSIPISIIDPRFTDVVLKDCEQHKPDLVVFDNLAHLVGADYNDAKLIHKLGDFCYQLAKRFNSAVLVAAHPRKQPPAIKGKQPLVPPLRENSEAFFNEIMGSSHFVNSFGSLWGLQRNVDSNFTDFLGGTQRLTGTYNLTSLEMCEDGWFQIVSDCKVNLKLATGTSQRKKAWELLPDGEFKFTDAREAVQSALKRTSFLSWWNDYLLRLKLVVPTSGSFFQKNTDTIGNQAT